MMDREYGTKSVGYGNTPVRYEQCDAEPMAEQLTTQIADRLDQALKFLDMMGGHVRERADRLVGPEGNKLSDSNCKQAGATLDRGVMDRIVRQTREVMVALEYLETQIRRFDQL